MLIFDSDLIKNGKYAPKLAYWTIASLLNESNYQKKLIWLLYNHTKSGIREALMVVTIATNFLSYISLNFKP